MTLALSILAGMIAATFAFTRLARFGSDCDPDFMAEAWRDWPASSQFNEGE